MPNKPVLILHGWSDSSASFVPLANWLKSQGFDVVDIYLGDYISMHDEITLFDIGLAFQNALAAQAIATARHSFDLIVHSTGGLVALEYLRQVCRAASGDADATLTPVRNLCFLAPANFGSPLAAKGKSVIGRTLKGWNWDKLIHDTAHLGQTGQRVLDALELAAPYSWQLGRDCLFNPDFPLLDPANVRATVMVGSAPYTSLARFTHEPGSDGTVRVATANLTAHYYRVDFAVPDQPSLISELHARPVALAVFNRNHSTIHKPAPDNEDPQLDQQAEWATTILSALSLPDDTAYTAHFTACASLTQATFAAHSTDQNFHQYMHVIFRVRDQFGESVPDYVVDFFPPGEDPGDRIYGTINGRILEKVTKNSLDPDYRSFFFDITDLQQFLASPKAVDIQMSLSAAPISPDVGYRNPSSGAIGIPVFSPTNSFFIHPNEPVLVDVTLHRDPSANVFKLTKLT
jgi:pimeloyl-ACP methyl ester carboxylesterase